MRSRSIWFGLVAVFVGCGEAAERSKVVPADAPSRNVQERDAAEGKATKGLKVEMH